MPGTALWADRLTKHRRPALIYELRIYRCLPGRLPALLKRFQNDTLRIWDRLGIRQAGFWTETIGAANGDLYYFLQWESLAEREAKWNAFVADAEWNEKRKESERDGPMVASIGNSFLTPTVFSSVK